MNCICRCGGIGKRCERRLWRIKRAERVAAVGKTRAGVVRRSGCRAPQQGDSVDLGAVISVKVFSVPLSLRTSPQTGVAIRSLKAGSPVFIYRGSGETPHLGYLPV